LSDTSIALTNDEVKVLVNTVCNSQPKSVGIVTDLQRRMALLQNGKKTGS